MEIRLEVLGWMDGWMAKVKFGDQIMEKFTWEGRRLWEFDVLNFFEGGYLGILLPFFVSTFFWCGEKYGKYEHVTLVKKRVDEKVERLVYLPMFTGSKRGD